MKKFSPNRYIFKIIFRMDSRKILVIFFTCAGTDFFGIQSKQFEITREGTNLGLHLVSQPERIESEAVTLSGSIRYFGKKSEFSGGNIGNGHALPVFLPSIWHLDPIDYASKICEHRLPDSKSPLQAIG